VVIFLATVLTLNLAIGVLQAPEDPEMTDIVMNGATDTNYLSLTVFEQSLLFSIPKKYQGIFFPANISTNFSATFQRYKFFPL